MYWGRPEWGRTYWGVYWGGAGDGGGPEPSPAVGCFIPTHRARRR